MWGGREYDTVLQLVCHGCVQIFKPTVLIGQKLHKIEIISNSNICFSLSDRFLFLANYLEISLSDARTHGEGRARFTDFKLDMKTNMPVFKMKDSSVRRRYSDFKVSRLFFCPATNHSLLSLVVERRGVQDSPDCNASITWQSFC